MSDLFLIVTVGTALLLLLGMFIAFMTLTYQRKRIEHQEEVKGLAEVYQQETLKAQVEMQEQTFLTISQEIHDNVGQILSLVRLQVSTIQPLGNQANEHKINSSKELLDQAISDLRDLSKRLNSKYTATQSFASLLEFQLGLIQKTGAIETQFLIEGKEKDLNPEIKLIAFRIVQEALNNIIRHAEASLITAQLVYSGQRMLLSIADDGKGIPESDTGLPARLPQGTGTHNMQYRANLIGATLRIESKPQLGTVVFLELSLN